jgi:hypothetical protein
MVFFAKESLREVPFPVRREKRKKWVSEAAFFLDKPF